MSNVDSKILEKITAYQNSLNEIQKRRSIWNETTKDLIFDTLTEIKDIKNLDWRVQKVEVVNNLHNVNLSFNKSHSGITQDSEVYLKFGGTLFFSQHYNGTISIFMEFPYVENWISEAEVLEFENTLPEKITEEYIKNQVVRFLDAIIKWEQSLSLNPIGYK